MPSRVHSTAAAGAGRVAAMLGAAAALAAAFAAGPARGAELYLKAAAGIAQSTESDLTGANIVDGQLRYDVGGTAAGAIGLRMAPFRFELEGGYALSPARELDATSITSPIGTFTNISNINADGSIDVGTALASAYVDIPLGWPRLTPYVGGGFGLAYFKARDLEGVIGGAHFAISNDDDILPAAHGEAGLVFEFHPHMALELAYRFFYVLGDAQLSDEVGGTFSANLSQHQLRIALRFYL